MLRHLFASLISLSVLLLPAYGQLSDKLVITEVMWDSGHPTSDDFGEGGHINGDWWELTNVSDEAIDMTGFMWDDDDQLIGNDFAFIPEFVIQPSEAVIVIREDEWSVDHPDGFRAAFEIPAEMRILHESFILGTDTASLDKHLTGLRAQTSDQLTTHLDGLDLLDDERDAADAFLEQALSWDLADIRELPKLDVETAHESLIAYRFAERVDFGGDSFSGLSSGGDEVNFFDADGNLIQSIVLEPSTTGVSRAWGFENGAVVDLGLSVEGEFGAIRATTDGSEGRLARDDDFSIAFDADGNAILNDSYVPEFLDVASPGRVHGLEVVFPEIDGGTGDPSEYVTLATVCGQVANGTASANDLAAVLQAAGLIAGDADNDGTVDFADFLILSSNFGTTPEVGDATFNHGDFDCSGDVGFSDFLSLSSNFGRSSAVAAAVPEPNGVLLAGLAAFNLLVLSGRSLRQS